MGAAIIAAIESGLGLISTLAQQFLSGFEALFWDATANQGAGALTSFGTYALVMTGLAITFGCISLVLGLITRNTSVNR